MPESASSNFDPSHIQSISIASPDNAPLDTTPLLARHSVAYQGHRRQATLLLQGAWPWRLQRAWLQGLAQFFYYERWTMRAWQLSLVGALLYDLVQYTDYPQARFGNTATNVLFGFAPNPGVISRHWGSDRPPETVFWLMPGMLMSLSLLSVLRAACYRPLPLSELIPSAGTLPFYRAKELRSASYYLSFGNGTSDKDVLSLIHNLGQTSLLSPFPLNYRAIASLASFAGRERGETEEFPEQAIQQAVAYLNFQLAPKLPWLRRLYTHYHLWRQGLDSNSQVRRLWPYTFGAWVLCQFTFGLFSRYHYWRLLGDKLAYQLDYDARQAACEESGKQFFYAKSQDKDVCALCPDWDFVRLADSDSLQACVNALLQQSLPPATLAERLARLQGHAGLTVVDLSGYSWAYEWSSGEFSQVLEALQAILRVSPGAHLQRLDVSNSLRQRGGVSSLTLQALAAFVEQTKPHEVLMRDYRLGHARWPIVLPAFVNHTLQLDISMSDFGDEGVWNLTAVLPGSALQRFIARDSGLSDGSAWAFNATWSDCALVSLEVAGNVFTVKGLEILASMFHRRPGERLDVSGTHLSAQGARRFWPVAHDIEQLVVRDCGLSEAAVVSLGPWLINSTLQVLDMTDNPLDDGAVLALAPDVLAAGVREWRLAHTLLSPFGFRQLGERLLFAAHLRVLDASGCILGDGSPSFFAGALQSGLTSLFLNQVGLTPIGLAHLTQALYHHRNTTLRELTLDGNSLWACAVPAFIEAVVESDCCYHLSLAGNGLNDTVLDPMSRLLAQERLQILQLRENQLTELTTFVPHGRSLQILDVADNALTGAGLMSWAQASLEPISYFDGLGKGTLTHAQRRDFSTVSATGALRLWNVSGHQLGVQHIRTLCRVAEQANYTVDVAASHGEAERQFCQRSSAAGRALPLGGLLSPWRHLSWALPTWREASAPTGEAGSTFRLFQASPTRSTPRSASLAGLDTPLLSVLFLSLLWLLRCCRMQRTREAFIPEADVSLRNSR
jgi:hypothetical protein